MKKIIVLGCGMVGSAIVKDLSQKHHITAVDYNQDNLHSVESLNNVEVKNFDLSQYSKIPELVADYDLVVGAVPGFMGYRTVEKVIEAGKNIVDISFFPEDCFLLDHLAQEKQVCAVVDCGVAPGMGNLILGHINTKMKVEKFTCYVGGLPFERKLPWQYKAPFSPIDVIEEYTRPARYYENSKVVVKEALSEPELLDFGHVGTLEAFNTDGLRSLLYTYPHVPNMKEKTLRYPGYIAIIRALKDTGFFSDDEIIINGKMISPLEFTSHLLINAWKLNPKEEEFTVMRIIIDGNKNNKKKTFVYDLFDRFDVSSGITSMARTTGYTCTAVCNLILDGKFSRTGICPPEFVGAEPNCLEYVLDYQRERDIIYKISEH